MLKKLVLLATLLTSFCANAATLVDPTLYDDLLTGVSNDLAGFTIVGPPAVWEDLSIRYGQWNGTPGTIDLLFTFNGTALTPASISSGAYFTNPAYVNYDISGLTVAGVNTLSVFGTLTSGGPTTYAVGEVTISSVPLPAAVWLFGSAMLGLVGVARRKKAQRI